MENVNWDISYLSYNFKIKAVCDIFSHALSRELYDSNVAFWVFKLSLFNPLIAMNFIEVVNLWTKECTGGTAEIRFVTSQHLVSGTIRIYISVHYRNHIWSSYHFKRRWRWPAKYCIAPSKTYFCGACKDIHLIFCIESLSVQRGHFWFKNKNCE